MPCCVQGIVNVYDFLAHTHPTLVDKVCCTADTIGSRYMHAVVTCIDMCTTMHAIVAVRVTSLYQRVPTCQRIYAFRNGSRHGRQALDVKIRSEDEGAMHVATGSLHIVRIWASQHSNRGLHSPTQPCQSSNLDGND